MLRVESGMSQEEVAEYLRLHDPDSNADKSIISRYEKQGVKPKTFKTVEMLARLFGVEVNYLTGYSDNKFGNIKDGRLIPILGTIAAGKPILAQEDIKGYEYILPEENIDFCLKVKGDSMINTRICDGDVVYVRKQDNVENGEIAVVIIDDEEATLKRFHRIDGTIFLRAENPNYNEIVISKKDRKNVRILGKVLYFKSEVK